MSSSSPLHFPNLRKWLRRSPPVEWALLKVRNLLLRALRLGIIPQHIAFIMDGNRRFAKYNNIETIEGHSLGFEALMRALEMCYQAGVKVVTVFAFSIENFKRTKYEVDALMDMAKAKLVESVHRGEILERYGAKLRFLGNCELFRPDVMEVIVDVVNMTKNNKKAILNICAPYTSRQEMTSAIKATVLEYNTPMSNSHGSRPEPNLVNGSGLDSGSRERRFEPEEESPDLDHFDSSNEDFYSGQEGDHNGVEPVDDRSTVSPSMTSRTLRSDIYDNVCLERYPNPENITAAVLESHLFTRDCPPLEILIRTSGVERLSDFMLWQAHQNTEIYMIECVWPSFGFAQFLPIILEWQWRQQRLKEMPESRETQFHMKID